MPNRRIEFHRNTAAADRTALSYTPAHMHTLSESLRPAGSVIRKILPVILSALLMTGGGLRADTVGDTGWTTLFDGSNLDQWNTSGDANWRITGDTVQADAGNGMLVSRLAYADFEIRLEFWAAPGTNSGVFIRCTDPADINPTGCYEVNIYDSRPDQTYRTGAIVDVAPPGTVIDTEDRWNTLEIHAQGEHLVIRLNGMITVDTRNGRLKSGPFALQYAAGGIRFRNVRIRPL
jgi:hypothetical protein